MGVPAADLAGRTILVVEDQPLPRDAMVMQLTAAGARVIGCASAEEMDERLVAAELGHGPVPDLLLLDLTLPGRGGLDTLRGLRGSARWKELPVVIVSAEDDGAVIDDALRAGCQGYLNKPVRVQHLITTCRRVVP
mgnify:CR=1 FL=1